MTLIWILLIVAALMAVFGWAFIRFALIAVGLVGLFAVWLFWRDEQMAQLPLCGPVIAVAPIPKPNTPPAWYENFKEHKQPCR